MMMQVAFVVVIIILIIIELLYIYRWLLRLGSGQIAHTWIQSSHRTRRKIYLFPKTVRMEYYELIDYEYTNCEE